MKLRSLRALPVALFFLLSFSARSQCLYTLEMLDNYGDGWTGCTVTINSGGNIASYTLDNVNDDGIDSTLTFNVVDGAPFVVSYTTGGFPWEVSFNIYDNTGAIFFSSVAPATGNLFTGTSECVSCGNAQNFAVENIWDNRARLRWQANNSGTTPPISWRVIYGPQGFSLNAGAGDTLNVLVPKVTITGLQKKTWYDAYVQQYCDVAGGYSEIVGPISFETYWTNDVGISGVVAPESGGCDLGLDSVKVILSNYGSAPQSLITFRYSINGQNAPVVPPTDGFFTGILGKDSSTVIAFETLTDFSASGEYRIDVFTQLANDEDVLNDTFTYFITNRLKPNYLQQFEIWSGGWTPGGQNASWQFGQPNKPTIPAAASGLNAWVTNLTGSYNFSELSYLESPCFDFSDLTSDPAIEFSLIHGLQQDYDGAWLEMTFDGGQNWQKVGEIGEGKNWYNTDNQFFTVGEVWSGYIDDWVTARHSLPNSAGESEVHLRFVMASSPFFGGAGIGVDDVHIFETFAKDLAGLSVTTTGETAECGLEEDQIQFTFTNFGNQAQTGIKIAYSINGGTPVVQNIGGSIATDQSITQTFQIPFDSRDQAFVIKCWTNLNGDQANANDTVTYQVSHIANPVPYQENFEAYDFPPETWNLVPSFGFSVTNAHNNISKVLAFNLYSGSPEFTADMPRMGQINAGDSLSFAYRITNFSSQGQTPTVLQGGTKIDVQVSTDCGETYQTINTISSFNHSPTVQLRTRKLSLDAFAGQFIKVRFKGTWGASDFFFDLDNINLLSCPADMDLSAVVTPNTPGLFDGIATVEVGLGNPPYSYAWSSGNTGKTATNLTAGTYTVTVMDAFGCSDELTIILGSSAVEELDGFVKMALFPNPTSGMTSLQATFTHAVEPQIEILNQLGQRVWYISAASTDQISESFDLGSFPDGLYLVRLSAAGKTITRKLVKG
jgi:hypothetical protein